MLATLVATLLLAQTTDVVELPIVNPGFESLSRPLAQGELTNGAGGVGVQVGTRASFFHQPQFVDTVVVPGWRTYQVPGATIASGVLNPPANYLAGHSGTYVASAQHVWMQQTLDARVRPRTKYTLTFLSGAGSWTPGDGVYMSLLASPDRATLAFPNVPGVTTLTQVGFFPAPGFEGQMLPYTVEITTPDVLPANLRGRWLAIAFVGSDGIPIMNFDDFRLTAERVSRRQETSLPLAVAPWWLSRTPGWLAVALYWDLGLPRTPRPSRRGSGPQRPVPSSE